jgi:hypothetical protein
MASERQIAANRANAKRSTGPKTLVGKMKSGRNALRHGLSLPLPFDMEASARGEAIVRALTHDQASDEQLTAATEVAQAQLELQRLAAVDRYERLGSRKRSTGIAQPPSLTDTCGFLSEPTQFQPSTPRGSLRRSQMRRKRGPELGHQMLPRALHAIH